MNYSLICATGTYTYLGIGSTHSIGRVLPCAPGDYIISGGTALMHINHTLLCEVGSYAYQSQTAYLQVISLTALPPVLYSTDTPSLKTSDLTYSTIRTPSDNTPNLTTDTATSTLSVSVTGLGPVSTLTDAHKRFSRVTESTSVSESNHKDIDKIVNESISAYDLIVENIVAGGLLASAVSYSESRSTLVDKSILSSISASESISKILSSVLIDNCTAIDLLSKEPNKYINDLGLTYGALTHDINAQDYILREDSYVVLREDGSFFLRNSVSPDEYSDSINYSEVINLAVSSAILSSITSNEAINIDLGKMKAEILNAAEVISIEPNKLLLDSIVATEQLIKHESRAPSTDSSTLSDIAIINTGKNISDAQSTSDSISSISLSKLLASSALVSEVAELSPINSQTYLIREDGSFILREDSSYIIREEFGTGLTLDSTSSSDVLSFNINTPILSSYSASDSISKSFSKPITDTYTANENVVLSVTNFMLRHDGTSYILREDGSYFIREA